VGEITEDVLPVCKKEKKRKRRAVNAVSDFADRHYELGEGGVVRGTEEEYPLASDPCNHVVTADGQYHVELKSRTRTEFKVCRQYGGVSRRMVLQQLSRLFWLKRKIIRGAPEELLLKISEYCAPIEDALIFGVWYNIRELGKHVMMRLAARMLTNGKVKKGIPDIREEKVGRVHVCANILTGDPEREARVYVPQLEETGPKSGKFPFYKKVFLHALYNTVNFIRQWYEVVCDEPRGRVFKEQGTIIYTLKGRVYRFSDKIPKDTAKEGKQDAVKAGGDAPARGG